MKNQGQEFVSVPGHGVPLRYRQMGWYHLIQTFLNDPLSAAWEASYSVDRFGAPWGVNSLRGTLCSGH